MHRVVQEVLDATATTSLTDAMQLAPDFVEEMFDRAATEPEVTALPPI